MAVGLMSFFESIIGVSPARVIMVGRIYISMLVEYNGRIVKRFTIAEMIYLFLASSVK